MLTAAYPNGVNSSSSRDADVIAIAGYGVAKVPDWTSEGTPWLRYLVKESKQNIGIWKFDYDFTLTGSSLVEQLHSKGHDLVAELKKFCHQDEQKRPIIFICHSIGGLILKKALCVLYEHRFDYMDVIHVIQGICFISTPHFVLDKGPGFDVLVSMMSTGGKPIPKSVLTGSEDNEVRNICREFRKAIYQVSIATFYETEDTKIAVRGIFAKLKKPRVLIIPDTLSAVGTEGEYPPTGIAKSHGETCKMLNTDEAFLNISGWLDKILKDSPEKITGLFRSHTPPGEEEGTLRSHSVRPPMPVSERLRDESGHLAQQPSPIRATAGSTDRSYVNITKDDPPQVSFETPSRKDPNLPCYLLPFTDRKPFFGREDILRKIDAKLLASKERPRQTIADGADAIRSFSLCGMGGIGKSAAALEYAHTRRSKFEAIFWIRAEESEGLALEFARAAIDLGLIKDSEKDDLQLAVQTFKSWLSRPVRSYDPKVVDKIPEDVSWLLIFDNVQQFEALADFWPREGAGSILLTSRDPLAKHQKYYTVDSGLDLSPLSEAESTDFIQHLMTTFPQPGREDALKEVVELLGGLPLLIEEMIGVIHRLRLPYGDFVSWWHKEGLQKISGSVDEGAYHSIMTRLGYRDLDDCTTGLLQIMAFLDPDCIQESILKSGVSAEIHNTTFPPDLTSYFKSRVALVECSMIQHNGDEQYIKIHRVTQDVARERLGRQKEVEYLHAAISIVSQVWPFQVLQNRFNTSRYDLCGELYPHIIKLRGAYMRLSSVSPQLLRPSIPAAALFSDFGWYWFERGLPQEAKPYFRLAQNICETSELRNTDEVSYMLRETHNNQGSAANETNDAEESLYHNQEWLRVALERRNQDNELLIDYELACAYSENGVAFAMNGRYDDAIQAFKESVRLYQMLPEYNDTMLGWPLPNLGFMYWVQGKYDEAEEILQEMRQVYEDAYGVDDVQSFKTGKVLYALGNVYTSMGKGFLGLDYHLRALRQYQTTLGPSHHRVADTCHRLADHYLYIGSYGEARKYIERALQIFRSRPYWRQELARSTFKKAQIFAASKMRGIAEKEFEKAYQIRKEIYPSDRLAIGDVTEAHYDQMIIFWSR